MSDDASTNDAVAGTVDLCTGCKGAGTVVTKRDHPKGAGITVTCSCGGSGVRTRRRSDNAGGRVGRCG